MKVAYRKRSPEHQVRMRERLQVAINNMRIVVGWDWELLNEHCLEVFGAISPDMTMPQLYRLFKDLYELYRFHQWRGARG